MRPSIQTHKSPVQGDGPRGHIDAAAMLSFLTTQMSAKQGLK